MGSSDVYTTRLMLTLISSLVKLATRCPDLFEHTLICLQKIWQDRESFDDPVVQETKDFLVLLQYPSALCKMYQDVHFDDPDAVEMNNDSAQRETIITDHPLSSGLVPPSGMPTSPWSDFDLL